MFEYDESGNLVLKSDGTNTTTYEWDEDNRLTLVSLPDASTIAYTYDMAGRMLTRTSAEGTTTFEWDGMDIVREKAPDGTVTRLYVVNGRLMSFERAGETYQVHGDALGHLRAVTDGDGAVTFSARYDAWGNVLTLVDNVAGGFAYRFVGAYGCRWDADTGLTYMRHRWYDASGLQRFISRDPIKSTNLYAYSFNNPARYIDSSGLKVSFSPKLSIMPQNKYDCLKRRFDRIVELMTGAQISYTNGNPHLGPVMGPLTPAQQYAYNILNTIFEDQRNEVILELSEGLVMSPPGTWGQWQGAPVDGDGISRATHPIDPAWSMAVQYGGTLEGNGPASTRYGSQINLGFGFFLHEMAEGYFQAKYHLQGGEGYLKGHKLAYAVESTYRWLSGSPLNREFNAYGFTGGLQFQSPVDCTCK